MGHRRARRAVVVGLVGVLLLPTELLRLLAVSLWGYIFAAASDATACLSTALCLLLVK